MPLIKKKPTTRIEKFKDFMRSRTKQSMFKHTDTLLNTIPECRSSDQEGFKYLNAMNYKHVLDDMEKSLEEYYDLFIKEEIGDE